MKKIILMIVLLIILLISFSFVFAISQPNSTENYFNNDTKSLSNTINETLNETNNQITNETDTTIVPLPSIDTSVIVDVPPTLENGFELPLIGSSGYTSILLNLYSQNSTSTSLVKTLEPGTGFQILEDKENWWYISVDGKKGWIQSKYCMINLPDVLPSIVYDNTNSYQAIFMSSGEKLPNITGKSLYHTYENNKRLAKKQFIMPVMYDTAKKIAKAQHLALQNQQSLKIYETFRPYQTQKNIVTSLSKLMDNSKTVKKGICKNGWNESWFIAQGLSNHQRGIAIDVSLVDIKQSKYIRIGKYLCIEISKYEENQMPTNMHELSAKAVTFQYGVASQSKTAWKGVAFAKSMTISAKTLQNYFVQAGMYPLSSEWWHFNDLQLKEELGENYSTGQFFITNCYSTKPK